MYWKAVVGVKKHQENSCTLASSNSRFLSHVWIHFHLDAYHSSGLCASCFVCLHVLWCVSECVCFNSGWRGHIIKTSHFTGIPFTPYCLPHCWKIQVIYQSIQATCVLFPMCFMHSLLSVYLLWAVLSIVSVMAFI